jgi:small conductance mechanosensitive channel
MESTGPIKQHADLIFALVLEHAPRILLALLTLIVGLWVVRAVSRVLGRGLTHRRIDPTLVPFLSSLLGWGLKILLFISVASMIGIQTTSFVAILGAAGLAVGLALQGSLANFAGGMLILIFRPYKVGDLIESQGQVGVVREIQIFTTTLVSADSRRIIIPNGSLSNGIIKNHSAEGVMRVDLTVSVSYAADLVKAKAALLDLVKQNPHVLSDPAPVVAVSELGDGAVHLVIRPSCLPEHYWAVYFETLEKVPDALTVAGVPLPIPRRDIHVIQQPNRPLPAPSALT